MLEVIGLISLQVMFSLYLSTYSICYVILRHATLLLYGSHGCEFVNKIPTCPGVSNRIFRIF
ncbi:hypothetical protein M422DRAFT_38030 [Sphaerobolus stellatus SS14]|uniref:Uncharacterized protein n=1 Tax=Sphaerobolus stellatus (strain SS14) TaxID=990650 RepID=A0A0C9UCV9_SPHS4|nr:hypothetical protein M422DRAFT_38030 [Sphaerobolus stellatus SS14]